MAKKKTDEIKGLSFEDGIGELTDIVNKIEAGQTSLQDSLGQYEKGMALIKHCRGILQTAEKKIEKITASQAGKKEKPDESNEENSEEDTKAEGLF
jgi:exodeoxyribonuclease VII small subunit